MIEAMGRLADRVLGRIAPRIDAAAGCSDQVYGCGCSGGLHYGKVCWYGCPGVPNWCGPCNVVMGTC